MNKSVLTVTNKNKLIFKHLNQSLIKNDASHLVIIKKIMRNYGSFTLLTVFLRDR